MRKIFLLIAIVAVFTSCKHDIQRIQPHVYGTFDAKNKTIAVPPKNTGFTAEVKQALHDNGWRIKISGLSDQLAEHEVYSKSPAKYTLIIREKLRYGYNESDYEARDKSLMETMLTGGLLFMLLDQQQKDKDTSIQEVNATIIDNKTGDQIMSFYAREVLPKHDAQDFINIINNNTK